MNSKSPKTGLELFVKSMVAFACITASMRSRHLEPLRFCPACAPNQPDDSILDCGTLYEGAFRIESCYMTITPHRDFNLNKQSLNNSFAIVLLDIKKYSYVNPELRAI